MSALLDLEAAQRIVASSPLPPRPTILADIAAEQAKDDPSVLKIVELIQRDAMLAASVLKTVNSPAFGLNQRTSSVQHAVTILGLRNVCTLVTGFVLRQTIKTDQYNSMEDFWENAARMGDIAAHLARTLKKGSADGAYTFVLFRDCGIPLMLQNFKDYPETLKQSNETPTKPLPDIETERHSTSHTALGFLLATNWLLPDTLAKAIAHHHDTDVFAAPTSEMAHESKNLIALARVAEHINHTSQFLTPDLQWPIWEADTLEHLQLSLERLSELSTEVEDALNTNDVY